MRDNCNFKRPIRIKRSFSTPNFTKGTTKLYIHKLYEAFQLRRLQFGLIFKPCMSHTNFTISITRIVIIYFGFCHANIFSAHSPIHSLLFTTNIFPVNKYCSVGTAWV